MDNKLLSVDKTFNTPDTSVGAYLKSIEQKQVNRDKLRSFAAELLAFERTPSATYPGAINTFVDNYFNTYL